MNPRPGIPLEVPRQGRKNSGTSSVHGHRSSARSTAGIWSDRKKIVKLVRSESERLSRRTLATETMGAAGFVGQALGTLNDKLQ